MGFPDLRSVGPRAWIGILWLGPIGTTATYLYWMSVISRAPVASLALTLFVQPLFGAAWGMLFLGDNLTGIQLVGGLFIVIAVLGHSSRHGVLTKPVTHWRVDMGSKV